MDTKNDSKNPKIYHRYIRRDSSKQSIQTNALALTQKKNQPSKFNQTLNKKTVKNPLTKYQSSSLISNKNFTRKRSAQILTNQLSSRLLSKISITTPNQSTFQYKDRRIKREINTPRTPLIHSSTFQEKNTEKNIEKKTDYIKVNNLTYYVRCPYCKHMLNEEPNKAEKIITKDFKNYFGENKENISFNSNNNNYDQESKTYNKKGHRAHKSFYVDERGVIVFQDNNEPTTSIKIINNKSNLSKYINRSKVFGKKKNIGIYECPPPETQVFIRPII